MKKKLILYILSTVCFSILAVTVILVSIVSYQYEQNVRSNLKNNNKIIENVVFSNTLEDVKAFFNKVYGNSDIYVSFIDSNGHVIFNSEKDLNDNFNINNYSELADAKKNGEGYAVRYDKYLNKNVIYYASYKNSYFIRSSQTSSIMKNLQWNFVEYYSFIIIITIIISVCFAVKLSEIIIKPIKDLELTTSLVSKGEFQQRVKILSNDELGHLGKTFNHMAEQLQETIRDSLEKQKRMEAILNSMESGVVAIDRKNRVILTNPYAEKLFGIDGNVIGKNLLDAIRDFEIENVFNSDSDDFSEIKILWPKERILRIKTANIVNNEEKNIGKVAVVQDVTDIKKLENMRSNFVANVSHELKTPLTSIKGFAETLKYVQDDQKKLKFLNIIDEETERLTRLINDILSLSDIEAYSEKKDEIFNVSNMIINIYNLMKDTADKKQIKLNIVESCSAKIKGDKDNFKQMLINLVDNAIKYSETGDSVHIGSRFDEDICIIWVEDTGVGIPEKHIPRLFERFYRVDKARSRANGGTGLGLAIVKHIVMNFKGSISVESKLGKGSKFIIKLPYIKEE